MIVFGALMSGGIAGCEPRQEAAEPFEGTPQVVEDSVLLFPSGARHATSLRGLRYHDALSAGADHPPFLVLSGVPGGAAESARIVVVVRADRPSPTESARAVFPYPGARVASASADSVRDVRLFVGECVPGGYGGVVQVSATADSAASAATVVAHQITGDSLTVVANEAAPELSDVLTAVESGACREVPRLDAAH